MRSLDIEDGAWGGIAAVYSIIHIPRPDVVAVLREMKRVLQLGGSLFLAFHIGDDVLHMDEWWGQNVSVDRLSSLFLNVRSSNGRFLNSLRIRLPITLVIVTLSPG
jgi:ubiquinone/menaquinone biosynthesis C-methylase UbiE